MQTRIDKRFLTCMYCPNLCLDRCPVVAATGDITYAPFAKMSLAGLLDSGLVFADRTNALVVYQCIACMACTEYCEHNVDVADALLNTRQELVKKGITGIDRTLFDEDQDLLDSRLKKGFPAQWFEPGLQGVLMPGRAMLRGPFSQMHALTGVLSRLRIQYLEVAAVSAMSTGYDLYAAGFLDDFKSLSRAMYARLRKYKIVVTPSPVVEYTLKVLYTLFNTGSGPQVRSLTEVIKPLVLAEKNKNPLHLRMAFHDCSFAGRYLGRYEEPRQILAHLASIKPLELRRTRENAMSCGFGGGFQRLFPDEALRAAMEVLKLARDAGAQVLVTEAPECYDLLGKAARKLRSNVRVRLLFDLVYQWLKQNR